VQVRFVREAGGAVVKAAVRGPKAPPADEVSAAQASLPPSLDGSALKLRFVETVIVTPQGPVPDNEGAEQQCQANPE
jgi:hypothetical protein